MKERADASASVLAVALVVGLLMWLWAPPASGTGPSSRPPMASVPPVPGAASGAGR